MYKFKCMMCKGEMKLDDEIKNLVCVCGRKLNLNQAHAQQLYPFVIAAGTEPVPDGTEVEV